MKGDTREGMVAVKDDFVLGDLGDDQYRIAHAHSESRLGIPSEGQGVFCDTSYLSLIPGPVSLVGINDKGEVVPRGGSLGVGIQPVHDVSVTVPKGKGSAVIAAAEKRAVGSGECIFNRDKCVFRYRHMLIKLIVYYRKCKSAAIDNATGMDYALGMKRTCIWLVVLLTLGTTVWAQLGTTPSGFSPHESVDLELSIFYPDGWYVSDQEGGLAVVNREGLLDDVDSEMPTLQPGDTALFLGVMPTFFMTMMGIPVDDISSILDGLFDNIVSTNDGVLENSQKEVLNIDGRRVATVTFDDSSQDASGIFFVAHEQDEVIIFAVGYGFRTSLDRNRSTLGQIVASAEFTGDFEEMMQ